MGDMNNTDEAIFGERGVFCPLSLYSYPYAIVPRNKASNYVELLKHDVHIRGSHDSPITYSIDATLGYDFMTGAGIKAFIIRKGQPIEECLAKDTCIQALRSEKNQLKF